MVIFHSYVSLPESNWRLADWVRHHPIVASKAAAPADDYLIR